MSPTFDPTASEDAKLEGIERVINNARTEWKDAVARVIADLGATGRAFGGDEVRALAARRGIPEPHHPNCWGACMRAAAMAGVIEPTGRITQSAAVSRHAGKSMEWVGVSKEPVQRRLFA